MLSMTVRMFRQLPPTEHQTHGQDLRTPGGTRPHAPTNTATLLSGGVQHTPQRFQLDRRTDPRV